MNYIAFDCHRRYAFGRVKDASERGSGSEGFPIGGTVVL